MRTQGAVSGYEFVVGTELTAAFAAAAKAAVRGPVGTAQLSALRTAALAGDESVSDHERMFMAGLLDAGNATALKRSRFRSVGDKITLPAAHDHHRPADGGRRRGSGGAAVRGGRSGAVSCGRAAPP